MSLKTNIRKFGKDDCYNIWIQYVWTVGNVTQKNSIVIYQYILCIYTPSGFVTIDMLYKDSSRLETKMRYLAEKCISPACI